MEDELLLIPSVYKPPPLGSTCPKCNGEGIVRVKKYLSEFDDPDKTGLQTEVLEICSLCTKPAPYFSPIGSIGKRRYEMSLREFVDTLPAHHRAVEELNSLVATLKMCETVFTTWDSVSPKSSEFSKVIRETLDLVKEPL